MVFFILARRRRKFFAFRAPQTIFLCFLVTFRKNLENASHFFEVDLKKISPKRKNLKIFSFQMKKTLEEMDVWTFYDEESDGDLDYCALYPINHQRPTEFEL